MSGGRRVERRPGRRADRSAGGTGPSSRRPAGAPRGARERRAARAGGRSVVALLLPLLALGLVLPAALAPRGGDDRVAPRPVPVQDTRYACAGGPGVVTGQVSGGGSASATVSPTGDAVDGVVDPARWVRADLARALGRGDRSLVVAQRGDASGAVGFVTGVLGASRGDGLVVGRCPGVVDDAWYAGLGSAQRHQGALLLTNLADTPAVLDVTLWSTDGPVDAVGGEGLVVEPGATRTVQLSDLAAGEDVLGVHVARRRGAVAVAALDTSTGSAQGSELVSAVPRPARRVVLGGLPADGSRTLTVLNPGDATARARVEVLGPDGTFSPDGLDEVRVRAGSVTTVRLPASVGDAPAALRVVADTPVVATATSAADGDVAVLEGVRAWTGAAVVPVGGDAVGVPDLLLTAPGDAGRTVVLEGRGSDLARRTRAEVSVPAGTTVAVDLARTLELSGVSSVVVRSEGGVVGTARYSADGRRASLAIEAAPVEVLTPGVRPAP